ncbi:MAG: LysR family transcriptional regulator [Clostridium sp.]|nr:LysR family transcriptional regulator [Clostridium sp.]
MNQNLNYYKAFYMVAKYKNISKAADALFISQPAISKSLSRLEENLGCTLFSRTSRGVSLTADGEILYERIREAFAAIEAGEEELRHRTELGIGQLRIGVSTTLCKYILLPYLQNFIRQHPHIRITIECQSTLHTVELLESGQIDIGLIGAPKHHGTLTFLPLKKIQDTFVATQSYLDNLSIREHTDSDLFLSATLMLLDEENITRQYINDYFYRNQIKTNQILEVSSMDLLIEFAKIGIGAACVIREFVGQELKENTLIEIPMAEPIESRSIGFAYSNSHKLSKSALTFLNSVFPYQAPPF